MKIIKQIVSSDGKTTKYLQQTDDNHIIETSYFNLDEQIVCISTQVGCPIGCIFCASGQGFVRNLSCEEIVEQVANILKIHSTNTKPILLSYMGMGEPFLNYQNVVGSIRNLASVVKRATIATTGICPVLIKKLAKEKFDIQVKLQLSLHAPNDELRRKIMPCINPIKDCLEAMSYFVEKKKESMKINYVLIEGVNDSKENALELVEILKSYKKRFIVKLIVLNKVNNYKPSGYLAQFRAVLDDANIKTVIFAGDGLDIQASCGQLKRDYIKNN